jgi:capsular polysaccharide biosynthesis protein
VENGAFPQIRRFFLAKNRIICRKNVKNHNFYKKIIKIILTFSKISDRINTVYLKAIIFAGKRKVNQMERTFTLNDIISMFLKRLWLILILALIGGIIAYSYSQYVITKKYTASVTLYVYNQVTNASGQQLNNGDLNLAKRLVSTYLVILKSNQVLDTVSQRIAMSGISYSAGQIRGMIKAASVSETEVFEVSVSCDNKAYAKIIADTISIVAPPEIIRVVKAGSVEVVDKAVEPTTHSSPNITQNTIIGIMLGIALALGLAFLLELMNTSIKSKDDLVETYNFPVLTMIPNLAEESGTSGYTYYKYEYGYGYGYGASKSDLQPEDAQTGSNTRKDGSGKSNGVKPAETGGSNKNAALSNPKDKNTRTGEGDEDETTEE